MEEVVLIDLKIDQQVANKSLDAVLQKQEELVSNTKELTAEQKKLRDQGESGSETFKKNAKQIELNKESLKKNKQEATALTKAIEVQENSVEALVAQNKLLVQQRNKVDGSTKEGKKRIAEINGELDKNNSKIKENVSGLEKQKINIGNYGSALDRLVPGLSGATGGIQMMTNGMTAFTKIPMVLLLSAIVLALASLSKFLTGSAEGQDKLNKITTVASAIFGKFTDVLVELGSVIFDKLGSAFNFLGGLLESTADLLGINIDSFDELIDKATELANLKNATDVLERELVLLKATSEARIAELKLRAEDKSLDLVTRQAATREAIRLQEELTAKQIEFAQARFDIKVAENAQSASTKEDLLEQAELEANLFLVKKEGADKLKEVFIKDQELRSQLRIQEQEEEANARALKRAATLEDSNSELSIAQHVVDTKLKLTNTFAAGVKKIQEKLAKDVMASDLAILENYKIVEEEKIAAIGATAGMVRRSAKTGGELYKATASIEAGINARAAAIAAYKSMVGIPVVGPTLAVIAAAAAAAFGLQQIQQIQSATFEQGGEIRGWTLGGRDHSQGGTKFVGSDGTRFEAQEGEGIFVLKREAHRDLLQDLSNRNTRAGGISLTNQKRVSHAAQGGEIAVANIPTQGNGNNDLNQVVEAIQDLVIVVGVEEIVDGLQKRAEVVELTTPIR